MKSMKRTDVRRGGLKGALAGVRESFRTKETRYGGYAALITLAVIAGLILLNLIVGTFAPQIDMTESGLFSLSDQTIQVLDSLPPDASVNLYGLWKSGEGSVEVEETIDLYLKRSGKIHFQTLDPDKNPGFLARFDKDGAGLSRGSVIVEGPRGFRVIAPQDMYDTTSSYSITGVAVERRLTGALLYAASGSTPVVYELAGHNETPLADVAMTDMIERENFLVTALNLLQVEKMPEDASALVINAPRRDLTRGEVDKILAYLQGGGRLLVTADYRIRDLPLLNEILASYGIAFDYGLVQEPDSRYTGGMPYTEIPDLADHDVTRPLTEKNTPVVLLLPMGVSETATKRRTLSIKPLLTTSASSWLRRDIEGDPAAARQSGDPAGPVTVAVAVTDPEYTSQAGEAQARVVAVGSGFLLEPNPLVGQQIPGNLDFFMNALTWLEDRPETLSVRSKSLYLLPLRVNTLQIIVLGCVFVIVIPLGFFVAGLVTWLRRRHL